MYVYTIQGNLLKPATSRASALRCRGGNRFNYRTYFIKIQKAKR